MNVTIVGWIVAAISLGGNYYLYTKLKTASAAIAALTPKAGA